MKLFLMNFICVILLIGLTACGSKSETKSPGKSPTKSTPAKNNQVPKTKEPLTMFNAPERYVRGMNNALKGAKKLQFLAWQKNLENTVGDNLTASNSLGISTVKGIANSVSRLKAPADIKKVFEDSADKLLKALSPYDDKKAKPAYKEFKALIDATVKKFG